MAFLDYRLCDKCEAKVFYDSELNYDADGKPYRVAGEEQAVMSLEYLGDWAVLCVTCAEKWQTAIVPREMEGGR